MCYRWPRALVLTEVFALDLATETGFFVSFSAQFGEFLEKFDQKSVSLGTGRFRFCRLGPFAMLIFGDQQ